MKINKEIFGRQDDKTAWLFTLSNENGMSVSITNFGANIVNIMVPDQNGNLIDVALGYDNFDGYRVNHPMLGATCGRNVNRISNAEFMIDGSVYHLVKNRGQHNIHSDKDHGFHKVFYDYHLTNDRLTMSYHSPDFETGFPGALDLTITYSLSEKNDLIVSYYATCTKKTLINITNHSYFNLNGHDNGNILDHEVFINASRFTPVDQDLIPTGQIEQVQFTPMDFTQPRKIRDVIDIDFTQLHLAGGFDHNFAINKPDCGIKLVASVFSPVSGLKMSIYSDLEGLQFYTGNTLNEPFGKGNTFYKKYGGLCLEPQYFPNAINTPSFRSPVFEKGQPFKTTTIYNFSNVKSKNI